MRLNKVIDNLSDIEVEISNFIEKSDFYGYDNENNGYYFVACILFEKVNLIELGDYLEEEVEYLSSFSKASMKRDWKSSEIDTFLVLIRKLKLKVNTIKINLEKTIHNSSIENVYAIKLPEYENFYEVVNFGKELNLIFKMVVGDENKVKLVGFDVGSEWYLIGFELYQDFKLFAEFMVCVYASLQKTKEDEVTLKQIPQEDQETIKEYMQSIKDVLVKNNLKKIEKLKDRELTTEEIGELEKSLIKMEKLVQMGTEVHIDRQSPPKNEEGEYLEEVVKLPSPKNITKLIDTNNPLLLEENSENEDLS